MAHIDWKDVLGWSNVQTKELRFAAFSLIREGQYKTALSFFEMLTLLEEKNLYDIQTLGSLYLQIGEREKAIDWFNRALALAPGHETILLNKAKALLLLNRKDESLAIINSLEKSIDPTISGDASALKLAYF